MNSEGLQRQCSFELMHCLHVITITTIVICFGRKNFGATTGYG
jgi:hypothetical protein